MSIDHQRPPKAWAEQRAATRKAKGFCRYCPGPYARPVVPGTTYCAQHKAYFRERSAVNGKARTKARNGTLDYELMPRPLAPPGRRA